MAIKFYEFNLHVRLNVIAISNYYNRTRASDCHLFGCSFGYNKFK